MTYKDYFGSVNFSEEDEVFHGKIEFIKALITYEGTDVKSLKKAFHEAVDDYLEICEAQGRKPEKIFKGSFNIRIKPELHRQISIMAAEKDINVNKFISDILEASVKNSSNISSQTTLQENTTLHGINHQLPPLLKVTEARPGKTILYDADQFSALKNKYLEELSEELYQDNDNISVIDSTNKYLEALCQNPLVQTYIKLNQSYIKLHQFSTVPELANESEISKPKNSKKSRNLSRPS
jgi:predicted HicB family RNase H-like nuclease